MNPTENPCPLLKFAVSSLALDSVRQILRPFGLLSSRTPLFPPSGPATGSFNGLHRESTSLATQLTEKTHGRGCF